MWIAEQTKSIEDDSEVVKPTVEIERRYSPFLIPSRKRSQKVMFSVSKIHAFESFQTGDFGLL